jgi:regulator of sigma E protease
MSLIFFILLLVVLVWVHELGHFSVAKLFGIRVDEFAIGFPPRLLTVKWGETRYSFNLLLVGGYVSIYGEDGDTSDPRSFARKSRWVQAAVVVAGIAMNVVFAWLILSAGYMYGLPSAIEHKGYGVVTNARPTVVATLPNSPAAKAGMEPNDVVLMITSAKDSFDTRPLNTDHEAAPVHDFIVAHADSSLVITVLRNGVEKNFVVRAAEGIVEGKKVVGVELDDVGVLKLLPPVALAQGALIAKEMVVAEATGLSDLVVGAVRGNADLSQVSGPVGIATIGSQAVSQGYAMIITITALISINLALINILPVPGLDGGRLLFIIIEGIMRRPISKTVATTATLIGFGLLVLLMIVVTAHDIAKLIG